MQLVEMSENQISIQSHSHIHEAQAELTKENIKNDICKSLNYLNQFITHSNLNLSYVAPFGISGSTAVKVKRILKELGIELAFLGKWGSVTSKSELLDMKRIPIYGRDSLNEFKLKTNGAYDWIGILHEFYKEKIKVK